MAIESMDNGDVFIPRELISKEVGSIELDTPYEITLKQDVFSDFYSDFPGIWVDELGRLMLHKNVEVKPIDEDTIFESGIGTAVIVKTYALVGDEIQEGYVVDLRNVLPGSITQISDCDEAPDDQEEFNAWLEAKEARIQVKACVIDSELDGASERDGSRIIGSQAFFEAAKHLASEIDRLEALVLDKFNAETDTVSRSQKNKRRREEFARRIVLPLRKIFK